MKNILRIFPWIFLGLVVALGVNGGLYFILSSAFPSKDNVMDFCALTVEGGERKYVTVEIVDYADPESCKDATIFRSQLEIIRK